MNRTLATITLHVSATALSLLATASLFAANEYQIELSVDPDRGTLHGKEKVVYKNETEAPLDTLFLEAPGLTGNPATPGNERWRLGSVVDAKGNNAALTWKPEEEAYSVHLSTPLGAGFKTTFTFEYERNLTPADRAAGYLSFPDRDAATWYLKFRAYRAGSLGSDDFKDISVALTASQGWTVASSASPGPAKGASTGGKAALAAKGVRNFALALGEGMRSIRGTAGAIPVVVYFSADQEPWSKQVLAETSEAIAYYLAFLGAFPPSQVSVLPADPGDATGNSSTQVIYAPSGVSEATLRDAVSLQTARLVWGWSVGDPADATPFVANGLAIWCQQNYLAKKNNLDLHAQYLKAGINDTYLVGVLRGFDTTLLRTRSERAKLDWDFDRIVARAKSAAVMHMLGGIIGEDKLQEVTRGILRTSRQAILTDRDFQKLAQAATTARLDGFFDQWLRRKDTLDYSLNHVRVNKADAGFEVHADVWKTGSASMPVEIIAEDVNGAKVRAIFPADRTSGEMAIPLKAAPAKVDLDPVQRLPLITRVGPPGRLDLAESLMVEGKLLRADEQVDRVLSDDPKDSRGLFMKGRVLKERGDWAGALALWSKVAALPTAPDDLGKIWSQLWTARLYDLQGKRTEAAVIYAAVAKLPDVRGSARAAVSGVQSPFSDSWPPTLP